MKTKALSLVLLTTTAACGGFAADEIVPPADDTVPAAVPAVTGTPPDDQLTEAYGVFVVAGRAPDAEGTRAAPLGSITAAIARARPTGKRVYVCTGEYREALVLASGVSVLGGYDCTKADAWKRAEAARSRISAPTSPAITALDVATSTTLSGFDVIAPAGTPSSTTSVGLFAVRSPALRVVEARIAAGAGHAGANGDDAPQPTLTPAAEAGAGHDGWFWPAGTPKAAARQFPGGHGGKATCGGTNHASDPGGTGEVGAIFECQDVAYLDKFFNPRTKRVWAVSTVSVYATNDSAPGAAGQDGAPGGSFGTFDERGYVPADGVAGTDGMPGHGGRGGGSDGSILDTACGTVTDLHSAPGGGGGGAGGCPGLAGGAGRGGGASIAAVVLASGGLAFERVALVAADGGAGGRGTLGSSPTTGGPPGANGVFARTRPAEAGGAGGRAGTSGSGGGGPSVALVHDAAKPSLVDSSTVHARGGAGVAAASTTDALGNPKAIGASPDGLAAEVHAL